MPNDLSVAPIAAAGPAAAPPSPPAAPAAAPETATPPIASPVLHLDAGLGMVVIEFRDRAGAVVNSIPTERQLQAYHSGAARPATEPQTQAAPAAHSA